jgi:hypothetical protein
MNDEATPRPWELRQRNRDGKFFIDAESGGEGYTLAIFEEVDEPNARLIVKAVNLHDNLVQALEVLVEGHRLFAAGNSFNQAFAVWNDGEGNNRLEAAIAALAKAKE